MKIISVVIGLTILGAILRLFNLSPFLVYPDSYVNLLIAHSIREYGSVVGFLGENGMFYPPFFMWSRPLFPLIIAGLSGIGIAPHVVGEWTSYLFGITCIPLSFFMLRSCFDLVPQWFQSEKQKKIAALVGAGLVAVSYNHTIWSGLVMTESIGTMLLIITLWLFFKRLINKTSLFSIADLFVGIFFALACLTRYEYLILLIPLGIFAWHQAEKRIFIINVLLGLIVTIAAVVIALFPLSSLISVIQTQLGDYLKPILFGLIGLIGIVMCFSILPHKKRLIIFNILPVVFFILFTIGIYLIVAQFLWGDAVGFSTELSFIREFIRHDFLLSLASIIGIALLVLRHRQNALVWMVIASIFLLATLYHRINPYMERYLTHVIPFLIIPASYALTSLLISLKKSTQRFEALHVFWLKLFTVRNYDVRIAHLLLSIVIIVQIAVTLFGLRNLNDPSWYRHTYQEQTAWELQQRMDISNAIILASFPEPYYYILQHDTHSIADVSPYIVIPDDLANREVIIIEDMGMRDVFPGFTEFLHQELSLYLVDEFYILERYHYTDRSEVPDAPVRIYKLKVKELKQQIRNYTIRA